MIFQIVLLPVGISYCLLLELVCLIGRIMCSVYSRLEGFVCPDFDTMIQLLLEKTNAVMTSIHMNAPVINSNTSIRSSCHVSI